MSRLFIFLSCLFVFNFVMANTQSLPRLDGRIVGGENANIEDFSYQISLMYYGSHICGGSIIKKNYVVTAGHCVFGQNADSLSIRAGSSSRNQGGGVLNVKRILHNPKFNLTDLDSDAAVLELDGEFNYDRHIRPVSLASEEPAGGEVAICSGWGKLISNSSRLPVQLQSVKLLVMPRDICQEIYGLSKITDSMICAAAPGRDSCQGDSGGPLVSGKKLIGIVSWGYGCADPVYPGVYANVADLREFIVKSLRSK